MGRARESRPKALSWLDGRDLGQPVVRALAGRIMEDDDGGPGGKPGRVSLLVLSCDTQPGQTRQGKASRHSDTTPNQDQNQDTE